MCAGRSADSPRPAARRGGGSPDVERPQWSNRNVTGTWQSFAMASIASMSRPGVPRPPAGRRVAGHGRPLRLRDRGGDLRKAVAVPQPERGPLRVPASDDGLHRRLPTPYGRLAQLPPVDPGGHPDTHGREGLEAHRPGRESAINWFQLRQRRSGDHGPASDPPTVHDDLVTAPGVLGNPPFGRPLLGPGIDVAIVRRQSARARRGRRVLCA